MDNAYRVRFLDKDNNVRTFIESGPNLDIATERCCDKLVDHIANAGRDLMHLDTVQVCPDCIRCRRTLDGSKHRYKCLA